MLLPGISIPMLVFCISLAISSITVAYCSTDRRPPCLMLSFIIISLVIPSFVLIFAFSPLFNFLIIFHVGPITRYYGGRTLYRLAMLYHMLLLHPDMLVEGFFFFLFWVFIISFSMRRWSVVDLPSFPLLVRRLCLYVSGLGY